jgi:hypothetical protein
VNRVDVRSGRLERQVRARAARLVDQRFDQRVRALDTLAFDYRIQRIEPLLELLRIVWRILRHARTISMGTGLTVACAAREGRTFLAHAGL